MNFPSERNSPAPTRGGGFDDGGAATGGGDRCTDLDADEGLVIGGDDGGFVMG